DGKQTVAKYLESVDKSLSIAKVVRFEVGEGIEKKEENFAEEVAKQMGM
ncbi:MAG: elongation factor Ts, partial [Firmicutes bacterium]|nr:elongation factor Ts [Bacillota bacterium]